MRASAKTAPLAPRYDGQTHPNELLDRLKLRYELSIQADGSPTTATTVTGYNMALHALLHLQCQRLMHLRQHSKYDDESIRQLETELDLKAELSASALPKE